LWPRILRTAEARRREGQLISSGHPFSRVHQLISGAFGFTRSRGEARHAFARKRLARAIRSVAAPWPGTLEAVSCQHARRCRRVPRGRATKPCPHPIYRDNQWWERQVSAGDLSMRAMLAPPLGGPPLLVGRQKGDFSQKDSSIRDHSSGRARVRRQRSILFDRSGGSTSSLRRGCRTRRSIETPSGADPRGLLRFYDR
jgi:hypothetical protein